VKMITLTHNGFHGHNTVRFRVPDDTKPGDQVTISRQVARRLDSAVCSGRDCQCGEHITQDAYHADDDLCTVDLPDTSDLDNLEIRGNYPQT